MNNEALQKPLRFKTHTLTIDDRERISITGVIDVDSFNEQAIRLLTEAGELRIEGVDLHITKLSLDEGLVMLEGDIYGLEYSDGVEERGSLFGRLFK